MQYNKLNDFEKSVIENKGTEPAFTGQYDNFYKPGTYICRKCNQPLYSSKAKFDAGCGWPAYDDHFPNSVNRSIDKDGSRIEITCSNCGGHLGHVFEGEGLTDKNVRHCVNSVSVKFVDESEQLPPIININETIILAGGCFWCTEAIFKQLRGVVEVTPGYTGGTLKNPTYEDVTSGNTGHAEAVQIIFDPNIITLNTILEIFFATHDPTTLNRQGNDIGTQYRSEVFYITQSQKEVSEKYILEISNNYTNPIVTKVSPFSEFYEAELYHKQYYFNNKFNPYCMFVISPKIQKLMKEYSKYISN